MACANDETIFVVAPIFDAMTAPLSAQFPCMLMCAHVVCSPEPFPGNVLARGPRNSVGYFIDCVRRAHRLIGVAARSSVRRPERCRCISIRTSTPSVGRGRNRDERLPLQRRTAAPCARRPGALYMHGGDRLALTVSLPSLLTSKSCRLPGPARREQAFGPPNRRADARLSVPTKPLPKSTKQS